MRKYHALIALVLAFVMSSCAKPPASLSPAGAKVYQANQAVVAIGTLQHAAIELNKIQNCQPMPCQPFLSDKNTGVVVDNVATALMTIRAVPAGWKATAQAALTEIAARLDGDGKTQLASYLNAASTVIATLVP